MIDVFPDFIQSFNKRIKWEDHWSKSDFFFYANNFQVSNYSISNFNNKILNLRLKFYNNCAKWNIYLKDFLHYNFYNKKNGRKEK